MVEKKHSKYLHVYAVVRVDHPINLDYPGNSISVVKVFASKEAAGRDADRLNTVNADKHCAYYTFTTRMVE